MDALVLSGGGGRGAYELGVYKAYREAGHHFDLISGSSVGAITAAAICSGYSVAELEALWARLGTFKVMQPRGDVWRFPKWTHLVYAKPLLKFIEREIDFDAVRASPIALRAAAVNVNTGALHVFDNATITPKRLLASASIPLLFPMVEDDGAHYWDGGTVANTPLQPAIDGGADVITCVLLSPVGALELPPPTNALEAITRLFDLRQLGNLKQDIEHAEFINRLVDAGKVSAPWRRINFHIVSPKESMGLTSLLNFERHFTARLIAWGYQDGAEFVANRKQDHAVKVEVQENVRVREREV